MSTLVLIRSRVPAAVFVVVFLLGVSDSRLLAGSTWDGGGSNDNWTTGANWNTVGFLQAPPPNNGTADVVMAGTLRLTPNVDAAWSIDSLRFSSTAGAFNIGSSLNDALAIGAGGILNESGLLQTIDSEIALEADQTWTADFGGFQINGDVNGGSRQLSLTDLVIAGNYGTIFSGRLTGLSSLTKYGSQLLLLNGTQANTFTGTTYVNEGRLRLDKQVVDGAIRGNLIVGDGVGTDTVYLSRDEQILASVSRTVTINDGGVFELRGFEETIENLAVRGGNVVMTDSGSRLNLTNLTMQGGTIAGRDPTRTLYRGVIYYSGSTIRSEPATTTGVIDAFLDLSTSCTFDVADGAAAIDLDLPSAFNATFTKTGAGTLRVHDDSRPLGYHLVAGTLLVGQPPPSSDVADITFEGGVLRADVPLGTFTTINITGAATIDGPNDLTLYGEITGPGGLTKRGTGTLTFGSIYSPNTYAGTTIIEEGTLVLNNLSAPNVAIIGNLLIGDGIGGPGADVVRLDASSQIASAPGRTVTVNDSGLFDVNGKSEAVQDLSVNGGVVGGASGTLTIESLTMQGGAISMGSGKLVANGNVTTLSASATASLSSRFDLGGQTRTIDVADGFASIDLDVPGAISNGGINKTSPGTLRLSGDNTFAGGVTVSAGTLLVDSANGSATGMGLVTVLDATLAGEGTIAGSLESRGLVSPGTSPGTLTVGGYYAQILDGELLIELAAADNFDQLLVNGDAFLAGTISVDLIDGFAPSAGQSFTILSANAVGRTFATESLPSLPGLFFDVIYNAQSVVLTVSAAFTADFDADGDVDGDDLLDWHGAFGVNALADADGDGDSDGRDFLEWQRQFTGAGPLVSPLRLPPSALNLAVPEPCALALASLVGCALALVRPRRRQDVLDQLFT